MRRSLLAAAAIAAALGLTGCWADGGSPIPTAQLANELCRGHGGVKQIVLEPYDPEYGGGGLEAVVCRDGKAR